MKLAEALILRADLNNELSQLSLRITNNLIVQEGEEPSEEPLELLKIYDRKQKECKRLVALINKTNNVADFGDGRSLMEALVERDFLMQKSVLLASIARKASEKEDRYSLSEIKRVSVVNVKDIQKQADDLSKKYRELDTKIQQLNWMVDLIEE